MISRVHRHRIANLLRMSGLRDGDLQPSSVPDENPVISESEVREIVRLLAEVAIVEGSRFDKRKRLMEGICRMVDADAWLWVKMGRCAEGELPTFTILQNAGFGEQQFANFLQAQEHPDMGMLMAPFLSEYAQKQRHLTRLRQQIDPEGYFPKSDVYELWRRAEVGPLMLSIKPIEDDQTTIICLYRRFDRELFSPRESRIAHILLSEVPWLHEEEPAKEALSTVRGLSPRLNTVLNLLLQGQGRKAIADQIDISIHTLNDYVKELYRRFDVHSQAELIRRFVDGDGGDRP